MLCPTPTKVSISVRTDLALNGFPIGGVAAFDLDEGIVSPGGVGLSAN